MTGPRGASTASENGSYRQRSPGPPPWTTTSDLIAVRKMLLEHDDPKVCVPAGSNAFA